MAWPFAAVTRVQPVARTLHPMDAGHASVRSEVHQLFPGTRRMDQQSAVKSP
jgi:hypothetical protein